MSEFQQLPSTAIQVHDDECEKFVLGTAIMKVNALAEIREFVSEDSFYVSKHKAIWKAIIALDDKGVSPDIITVLGELQSQGYTEITPVDIAEIGCKSVIGSAVPHALRLRDLYVRRQMWTIGHRLVNAGSTEVDSIDDVREMLREGIDGLFSQNDESIFTLEEVTKMLYELVCKNINGQGVIVGTPTGFKRLDEKGGLHKSDLVIVAGESSQGKTSFATSMVLHALQKGAKIAFYSIEMTKVQITARMAAMMSGVSSSDLLYSTNLAPDQLSRFDTALGAMMNYSLYFDDKSTSNLEGILNSIRSLKIKYDIDGVVVDYLQILNVNSKNNNKEQVMADAARKLKNLAKDLDIWVIALSQLNRDSQSPQPNLNRLRDSGQIAEAADVVLFVYRPEYYGRTFPEPFENESTKGKAMIDIAKGRNIGTMRFLSRFEPHLTLFSDIVEESLYEMPASNDVPF